MTYRYRYLGDLPTVFIHLRDANGTWTPSKDDEIEWHEAVQHPLLELVSHDADEPEIELNVPDEVPEDESPVTVDQEEN